MSRSSTGRGRRSDDASGFTLLEIVVAFTVAAVTMVAAFELFSRGVRGVERIDDYTRATLIAEERLETLGVAEPLVPGITAGRIDDRFTWQVAVTPAAAAGAARRDSRFVLQRVAVTVAWDGPRGRAVTLESLRLEAAR